MMTFKHSLVIISYTTNINITQIFMGYFCGDIAESHNLFPIE